MSAALPDLGGWVWAPIVVAFYWVPVAFSVAIVRFRLYEIDRIISRTVSLRADLVAVVHASIQPQRVGLWLRDDRNDTAGRWSP